MEGTVGGVALRHSAYTWWAMHRPVRTFARRLIRPATALLGRLGRGSAALPLLHLNHPVPATPATVRAAVGARALLDAAAVAGLLVGES